MINQKYQTGSAMLIMAILVMGLIFIIAMSITLTTLNEQRISNNSLKSIQAYYAAEGGTEDSLLRISKNMKFSSPNSLEVGAGITTVEISEMIGGSRTITSEGNVQNRIRKIRVAYSISTQKTSFYYGAQVGDGGIAMEPNSKIKGNAFSNANIVATNPIAGKGFITGSVIVAGNGNKIEGLTVGDLAENEGDATVHTCKDSEVGGTLTFVSGGTVVNCDAGVETKSRPNEIDPLPLPISDGQIENWKNEASCSDDPSCIYSGDYTVNIGETKSFGPKKIIGNLTIKNNGTLRTTGTIYVTQDITIENNATIKLDSSYGSTSGIVIADGKINSQPGAMLQGTGEEGSYIMLLSTNPSLDVSSPAIDVQNTATGAVFYASDGLIRLRNNMKIREATGYKLYLDNNAEIEYEVGLEDTTFSSGPSGGWDVVSWKEIE